MRHKNGIAKLSKPTDQRLAMLRNIVISLFKYEKIETTETRARAASKMAEKIITMAKKKNVTSIRNALKIIPDKLTIKKVFNEIAPTYETRNGGYVRIIKTRVRTGDAVQMAVMELVKAE